MMRTEANNSLHISLKFADFREAFEFLTKVADLADKQQHHPRILNEWNKVELWLSTHDAGNIVTDKDRRLAESINELLN